jgi:hypothetical protein
MTADLRMELVLLSLCLLVAAWNLTACSHQSSPASPVAAGVLITTIAPRDRELPSSVSR